MDAQVAVIPITDHAVVAAVAEVPRVLSAVAVADAPSSVSRSALSARSWSSNRLQQSEASRFLAVTVVLWCACVVAPRFLTLLTKSRQTPQRW